MEMPPIDRTYPVEVFLVSVVTFFQVAFDILASASVNIGYGHNFAPYNYIDAWLEITQPVNWSQEDTEKLKAYFAAVNPNAL